MFTGLVQDVGKVATVTTRGDGLQLQIQSSAFAVTTFALGESIAVNGVCLTVTDIDGAQNRFSVLAGAETLDKTSLKQATSNVRVNLERAMQVGDRLGGHWVQGHVDCTGQITKITPGDSNVVFTIAVSDPKLLRYVVDKGSIALDGTSLTVNQTGPDWLSVALIPHTMSHTHWGDKMPYDAVNIEFDILAKYLEKLAYSYK